MKQTITETMFRDAFRDIRPNNFSHEGLGALWEYLEQYEEDTGEELKLDVIALCCDFSEYTLEELNCDYGYMLEGLDDDEKPVTIVDWEDFLNDHTFVIPVDDNTVIVQDF